MTRIHFTDIVFDVARGLYEAGSLVKPQWGPVIIALSTGMATLAIRLIIFRQNRLKRDWEGHDCSGRPHPEINFTAMRRFKKANYRAER